MANPLLIEPGGGVRGRRVTGLIEQHSSFYGPLFGRDLVSGRLRRRPKFMAGRQATKRLAGPAGWKGSFFVRLPDRLGELAGEIDARHLGAALATEALHPPRTGPGRPQRPLPPRREHLAAGPPT